MRLSPHHHPGPYPWQAALLHPFKILAANLPWTIPALLTLRPGFGQLWNQPERRLLQLMHCWFWPSLLFWTLIPEHAMRHSFPMYPAVTGLAADGGIDAQGVGLEVIHEAGRVRHSAAGQIGRGVRR